MMKESLTISKVLKVIFSVYLAGSLFYATVHLLGFGWFQTSSTSTSSSLKSSLSSSPRSELVSVPQLQQKYLTGQTVTWINAEGKKKTIELIDMY